MLFFSGLKLNKTRQKDYPRYLIPPDGRLPRERRAPYAAFRARASLTVEASLALPIFIAAIVVFLFVLQVMQLQLHIQKALYNQTMKASGYAYYLTIADMSYKAEQVLEEEYIKYSVIKELGKDYLDGSCIERGSKGFTLNMSGNPGEGLVDVAMQYKVQIPFDILGIGKLKLVSRIRCHTWIGNVDGKDEDDSAKAYVTANGTVYHTHRDCTYITSDVESCAASGVAGLRNSSGAKYYACRTCCRNETAGLTKVYYTKYGTRYHSSATCSNLHSNVYVMKLEDAKAKYRQCSKCAWR